MATFILILYVENMCSVRCIRKYQGIRHENSDV